LTLFEVDIIILSLPFLFCLGGDIDVLYILLHTFSFALPLLLI